jgi:hypothetical protein
MKRMLGIGALAALLVGGVVGCSSDATPRPSAAPDHDAFSKCLTDNGIPAPPEGGPGSPPPGGTPPSGPPPNGPPPAGMGPMGAPPGVDQEAWDNAMQQCSSLEPAPPQG